MQELVHRLLFLAGKQQWDEWNVVKGMYADWLEDTGRVYESLLARQPWACFGCWTNDMMRRVWFAWAARGVADFVVGIRVGETWRVPVGYDCRQYAYKFRNRVNEWPILHFGPGTLKLCSIGKYDLTFSWNTARKGKDKLDTQVCPEGFAKVFMQ